MDNKGVSELVSLIEYMQLISPEIVKFLTGGIGSVFSSDFDESLLSKTLKTRIKITNVNTTKNIKMIIKVDFFFGKIEFEFSFLLKYC